MRLRRRSGCIYVDTYFRDEAGLIYLEEDYIDVGDIFAEYGERMPSVSSQNVRIGRPSSSRKEALIDQALMVSDSMAFFVHENSTDEREYTVVDIDRPNLKAVLRLSGYIVLSTNMSERMQKRAASALKRNEVLLASMTEVVCDV